MNLSAEQFADLLSSFYSRETHEPINKRRASRVSLQARITIIPLVGDVQQAAIGVTTCDFSARGISFIHTKGMKPGDQFITELPRRTGGRVKLLCEVIRSTPKPHGEFHRIGANFICSVGQAQPIASESDKERERIRAMMLG